MSVSDANSSQSNPEGGNLGCLFDYEAQHFGYTPVTLLNGIYNTVCDYYRDALKSFCQLCAEKYPTAMSEEELRKARQEVGKKIDNDVTRIFDSLECYLLRNVFKIPDNITLPEDNCQLSLPSSETERKAVGQQVEQRKMELKKKIIAVKYANALLSQHLEESKKLLTQLKTLQTEMEASGLEAHQVQDYLSHISETLCNSLKPAEDGDQ